MDKNSGLSEDTICQIASHYAEIMRLLGEDTDREGLVKTPMRAARALAYCTRGYRQDPDEIINGAIFSHEGSRMVIVRDIEFYSLCAHHILPFYGRMSVGYVPGWKTIGLSKLARLVDYYARRLQVQERLTAQICALLMDKLSAKGVMVVCEGEHLCMKMRGVGKQLSETVTCETAGVFDTDPTLREEFMRAIRR